ncbi:hypothetical protein BDV97DRAFT_365716 [Delphinella strobiligena]|nr:hypothetical protein BDV97DRAFT_365716 [Delphinella strobiligena]
MSKAGSLPDAWDDDWVNVADKSQTLPTPQQPIKISRAERKAQHQEANKQLWQAAEEPERFHFLEAKGHVPAKTTDFKPTVKVLSRKPQIAKPQPDPTGHMAGLIIDDGDDSEEEDRKRKEADFLERQKKAQLEREEKQRKYAEVRERLFGSPASASASPSREPSAASQNRSGLNMDSRNSSRKGRARGGKESSPASATHSPARHAHAKQLFDPGYVAKPKPHRPRPTGPREEQPIRAPRGPENSGRGGFGFAPRGGRSDA